MLETAPETARLGDGVNRDHRSEFPDPWLEWLAQFVIPYHFPLLLSFPPPSPSSVWLARPVAKPRFLGILKARRSVFRSTRLKAMASPGIPDFVVAPMISYVASAPPPLPRKPLLRTPTKKNVVQHFTTPHFRSHPHQRCLSAGSGIEQESGQEYEVSVERKDSHQGLGRPLRQKSNLSANVANPSVMHTIAPRTELSSAQFSTSGQRPPRCNAAKKAAG